MAEQPEFYRPSAAKVWFWIVVHLAIGASFAYVAVDGFDGSVDAVCLWLFSLLAVVGTAVSVRKLWLMRYGPPSNR